MKRSITKQLIAWKSQENRLPLILRGARRVGKTYILKQFGKDFYENTAYINLENASREIKELFSGSIDPLRIVSALESLTNAKIQPNSTLIILDEVQEVPRALTALKYFAEDAPEYHIAVAGSLLGVFLHKGTSFPVDLVEILDLEPMSFEEFLIASGEENLAESVKSNITQPYFNEKLSDFLRQYLQTGGMPEAISAWLASKDFDSVRQIQNRIIESYKLDLSKYMDITVSVKALQTLESLPAQFAKNNPKFIYGVAKKGARAREFEIAIEWLKDAGIVRKVTKISAGDKIPLKAYSDQSSFKLYFADVGLFGALAGIPSDAYFGKDDLFAQFGGAIAEQFVLQEFACYLPGVDLFYWTGDGISEVDFAFQSNSRVIPVEVKSGTNVKAKSLQVYRAKYSPEISIRFSLKPFEQNQGLFNIPLYLSFAFLQNLPPSSGF